MRRATKTLLLLAACAVILAPVQARADGFVAPWVGTNWGSDIDNGRAAFGVTAGGMGAGVIGGEFDLGFSPSFFGTKTDFGNNSVLTAMGNLIVGVPIGGTYGKSVRPFLSGGVGLIRTQTEIGNNVFNVSGSNNDFGWNAGAGLMGYFSQHVGLRGDIRYMRDAQNSSSNNLHFWRFNIGVTFK